jgi:hypothetical protein
MGNVIISPNIKRESVRINPSGDIIDPRTKQILQQNKPDYTPTMEEIRQTMTPPEAIIAPTTNANQQSGALSILDQIAEAEKNLANLKELKKLKIAEKKAELELLQQ